MKRASPFVAFMASMLMSAVSAFAQTPPPGCLDLGPCTALTVFNVVTTAPLAVTNAGARVAYPQTASNYRVVVWNTGLVAAFINQGGSGVVATTSNQVVPPGDRAVLTMQVGSTLNTYIAAITASGSTSLTILVGTGNPSAPSSGSGGSAANLPKVPVALDAASVTTAGTPVVALQNGHHNRGGWIGNCNAAGTLYVNDNGAASGTEGGSNAALQPGLLGTSGLYIVPSTATDISVTSSVNSMAICGEGYN